MSVDYKRTWILPAPELCCVNCSSSGVVSEIHIYSSNNVFERSVTILEALAEIFSTPKLQIAKEAKFSMTMCTRCAESLSHIHQAFMNFLSVSTASCYLTKLIAQIENCHLQKRSQSEETSAVGGSGVSQECHAIRDPEGFSEVITPHTGLTPMPLEVVATSYEYDLPNEPRTELVVIQSIPKSTLEPRKQVSINANLLDEQAKFGVEVPRSCTGIHSTYKGKYRCRNIQRRRYFKCNQCSAQFIPIFELHEHILTVHKMKSKLKCDKCSFTYLPEIIKFETHKCIDPRQRRLFKKSRSFLCEICGERFGGSRLLTFHTERVHTQEDVRYKCHYCGKQVVDRHKLYLHVEIHTESKSYLCFDCGKAFSQKRGLDKHLQIHFIDPAIRSQLRHSKEAGHFSCDICQRVFSYKRNLQQHQTMHVDGMNKYRCPICGKPHLTRQRMEKHTLSHETPRGSTETVRKQSVKRKSKGPVEELSLATDTKIFNSEKIISVEDEDDGLKETMLPCQACGESFSSERAFGFHLRKHMSLQEKLASFYKNERKRSSNPTICRPK